MIWLVAASVSVSLLLHFAIRYWIAGRVARRSHLAAFRALVTEILTSQEPVPPQIRASLERMARDYAPGRPIHSAVLRGLFPGRARAAGAASTDLASFRDAFDALPEGKREKVARAISSYTLAASYSAPLSGALFRAALRVFSRKPEDVSTFMLPLDASVLTWDGSSGAAVSGAAPRTV